jgi:hypothetical protein
MWVQLASNAFLWRGTAALESELVLCVGLGVLLLLLLCVASA